MTENYTSNNDYVMDDRLKPYIEVLRLVRKMMPNKEYNLAIYDKERRLAFLIQEMIFQRILVMER